MLLTVVTFTAATVAAAQPIELTADEIIARAIESHARNNEDENRGRYAYTFLSTTEKLDKDGEVKEVERERYESRLVEGAAFDRLVEKDGRALTEKELRKEDKREERFRERLQKGRADDASDDERVEFDEELIARYDIVYDSTETLDGHETYVLRFTPKSGKLPNRRRMDVVLNKARGKFWVDTESFQIARIDFILDEKVKLWWGMLGSVSNMTGELQRRPVDDGVWMPDRFHFYIHGRILFRSLHVRQEVVWHDFRERTTVVTQSQDPGR